MTIVDQIKKIASMVGVTATGSTIYEALDTFEKGLKAKQEAEAKKAAEKPAFEAPRSFNIPEKREKGKQHKPNHFNKD